MKTVLKLAAVAALTVSSLALAQNAPPDDSAYQGLGGKDGIRKVVATFIPLIKADPRIKEFFKDSDTKQLAARLGEQFCELSGGPCKYKGKAMDDIHEGLNITQADFNALTENLQSAMDSNNIPTRIQNKLVAKLAAMQRLIVTK